MTPVSLQDIYTQEQVAGWGWLIAVFLWLAGIAGMGSVAYYWYRRASMAYTLMASIVLALVFVVADLTRPWNLFNALFKALATGSYNWSSWMAIGIALLLVQTLLLLVLTVYHATGYRVLGSIAGSRAYLVLVGLSGFLVTVYSGFLISQASGIPFWNTPMIPVLWVISATVSAVAVLEILVSLEKSEAPEDTKMTGVRIGLSIDVFEIFTVLAFLYVAVTVGTIGAMVSAHKILYGELSPVFWIGVLGLGAVYPALVGVYTLSTKRTSKALIISAAILALIGSLLLRYIVLVSGVYEPLSTSLFK